MMKNLTSILALAFLCLAAYGADTNLVEMIVAKVNGDIVTRSELDRQRKQMMAEMQQQGATPQQVQMAMKERDQDVLRDRIDQLLLQQKGKDLNINVDTEVSKYLGKIMLDQKIADQDKFAEWIRQQTGMSFEDFKSETKNQFLTQRVIGQEVGSKINVPKSEIEAYYEKNKASFVRKEQIFLREILIATEGKDEAGQAAAEKKAKDIVARARKGERFHELARDNSDAQTAKQGGDLGVPWSRGDLNPEIEKVIWDQPRGYVTDPMKLPNGWLILKVEEHFKEGQAALADVENEIKEKLYMPLFQPKIREYLTQLRQEAFLELREGYVDTGAAKGKNTEWTDPAMLRPQTVTKEEVVQQTRMKRLLFIVPIPGTKMVDVGESTSK